MRWTNASTTGARRLARSGAPAPQADHHGLSLPEPGRDGVARAGESGPGADPERARWIGPADDASSAVNLDPIGELDPAGDLGLLRLRHVDRA